MMPKSNLITEINKINTSADPRFLAEFSLDDLQAYWDRLTGHESALKLADPGGAADFDEQLIEGDLPSTANISI